MGVERSVQRLQLEIESALRSVSCRLADSEPLETAAAMVPGGTWELTGQMDLSINQHACIHRYIDT